MAAPTKVEHAPVVARADTMQAVRRRTPAAEREPGRRVRELPARCQRWSSTASGVCNRTMNRPAWAGAEARVRWETTTIVRKDAGTDQAAGCPSIAEAHPADGVAASVQATANPDPRPPTSSPAT